MEKRGVIDPNLTPPEKDDTSKLSQNFTGLSEKQAEDELDAIRRLDGDFRKLAADAAKKAL